MKSFNVTIKTEAGATIRLPVIGFSSGQVEHDAHEKFGWLCGVTVLPC
ncbi:hypothetical protein [Herminiimonas sp. CN]|nr:hypothetical protein [Herminiimonas sp. CN]